MHTGKVIGKIENAKPEAATATEISEEPKTDSTSYDDEDEGHGFTIHM